MTKHAFNKLRQYCEQEAFKGYDPYDGLNSKLFQAMPFLSKSRLARLAWIQFFKRFPLNLRSVLGVKKEYNAKGLGLFLAGYCRLYQSDPKQEYLDRIVFLADELIRIQNRSYSGACWGYNFDWQARAFFQPKNTPTVVATTYISSAFLDAYDITSNDDYLRIARSACDFVMNDLNRTSGSEDTFAFSYSPLDKSVVYNASLLGSRLLARVFAYTREPELAETAEKSVRYCCNKQHDDGSWSYGEYDFHHWIDNFHTGFNLECIYAYMQYTGDSAFEETLNKGFDYYLNTFFTEDGMAKYYNNQTYPIDIHAPAQLIITLDKLGRFEENRELAERVLGWTIRNMQSPKGYFYYQVKKRFSSRIPYIRWAQAWMFYALTIYLSYERE